jgi:hypothetical protein
MARVIRVHVRPPLVHLLALYHVLVEDVLSVVRSLAVGTRKGPSKEQFFKKIGQKSL